jgi:predicted O-methyltransferase YrrM
MTKLTTNIRATNSYVKDPHLYTSPAGPAAEDEVADLLAALIRTLKPRVVLETGTAFGHTAAVMAKALAENGNGRLITVEMDPTRAAEAKERLEGLPAEVVVAKWESYRPPEGVEIALAFFDGSRDNRHGEFKHYRPWIPTGSIVAFHDTGLSRAGDPDRPKLAEECVRRLVEARLISTVYLPCPQGLTLGQVL